MPTVLRESPYRSCFVSLDRDEPAHIHVRRDNMVAKLWLDPLAVERTGGFGAAELNRIAQLVRDHQNHLLEQWHGFFAEEQD